MKTTILFLVILIIGCTSQQSKINESEVEEVVEGFFMALDVDNDDPNLIDQYVTEDFMIYEMGKKMNIEEFKEFISRPSPASKSDWRLSDFRISTDAKSAHASLLNNGTFEVDMDSFIVRHNYEWLESAYLVRSEDKLKIKFYFSDDLSISSDTIN